jgi:protein arginine N-methyltransferase 5
LSQALSGLTHMAVWVRLELTEPGERDGPVQLARWRRGPPPEEGGGASAEEEQEDDDAAARRSDDDNGRDTWATWNQVYTMCERSPLLGVMLDLSGYGRGKEEEQQGGDDAAAAAATLERWLGEPLRAVAVSTADFGPNRRGFPVLRRAVQPVVELAFQHTVQLVLTGPGDVAGGGGGGGSADAMAADDAAAPATTTADPTPAEAAAAAASAQQQHPLRPYWDFCSYLFRRASNGETVLRALAGGGEGGDGAAAASADPAAAAELLSYRDYLQAPLQPLQDNLESQTYETFERDTIKYERYREAVEAALVDLVPAAGGRGQRARAAAAAAAGAGGAAARPLAPHWSAADDPASYDGTMPTTVLMVVGAGRGPLVRASITAAEAAGRPLRVYALEKNPAALVHIQAMVARNPGWSRVVTIVAADMREWDPPEPADVLVSELLGSFGDNELSPECLDGAQRRLLRPGGISIPSSYTSYLAPCSAGKLWEAARAYKDLEHLETPYVVRPHRHALLSPPQRVFNFVHPNPAAGFYGGRGDQGSGMAGEGNAAAAGAAGAATTTESGIVDNSRRAALAFSRRPGQGPSVCHGFVGYFSCVLYKRVTLSTHPRDHTPDMASWFPIYFPLREPLALASGERLDVAMWRCTGRGRVWYEWAVTAPRATAIHNPGGRSYWVGL